MDETLASALSRQDSGVEVSQKYQHRTGLFDLPPEVRTFIYDLLFDAEESRQLAYHHPGEADSLNEDYYASDYLEPLLTCRQFHADAHLLAFSRTIFVVRNPFTAKDIAGRLHARLQAHQIQSIRSISFVAEADHFRQMRSWKGHAFGVPALRLENLDILLYRSSYWHYLFDFNSIVITLLRGLQGVEKITYIKNGSRVKPHFHTWFNRLIGAVLKVDQIERFGPLGCNPEKTWWTWEFNGLTQTAVLKAAKPKRVDMSFAEYEEMMFPIREELMRSIEAEAYDPDPMSRNGF